MDSLRIIDYLFGMSAENYWRPRQDDNVSNGSKHETVKSNISQ